MGDGTHGSSGMALNKLGGNQLILTGANAYTGKTTITTGTLSIGNGGSGASLASTSITNSATLLFNHTDTTSYSGTISGNGSVVQQGVGLLNLSGNNTYTGGNTITSGTLQMGTLPPWARGEWRSPECST